MTIKQGESYPIWFSFKQDENILTPNMIQDLTVCIGDEWCGSYKNERVKFDESKSKWFIRPTKEETRVMNKGKHTVHCHVDYDDGCTLIYDVGDIVVKQHSCRGCSNVI